MHSDSLINSNLPTEGLAHGMPASSSPSFFHKAYKPLKWFAAVLWAVAVMLPLEMNGFDFLVYLFGLVGCVAAALLFLLAYAILEVLEEVEE